MLHRVLVAVIVNDIQIGMLVDAAAPIGVQTAALVDLVNVRMAEIGEPLLAPGRGGQRHQQRGRWALCWVDGTPLRAGRSLGEQGVHDGATLWLRFIDDAETRTPVIEHVTSAVPAQLRTRWPAVTPAWAIRVGVTLVAVAVLLVLALLLRWRHGHSDHVAVIAAAITATLSLGAAAVVQTRSARRRHLAPDTHLADQRVSELDAELYVGDMLLGLGALAAVVGAAVAVPGPVGAAHVALGASVLVAAGIVAVRFTGRHIALNTAVVVLGAAALITALARMLLLTSAVTLLASLLLVSLVGIKVSPGHARLLAGLRLPVFPSASGRWIFETRPDLPSTVLVPSGKAPTLAGPESVREVVLSTDRAHGFLTGLLSGFGVLLVICATGLCDPHADRRWLPLVLAGVTAAAVLLHARSYTDRRQSTLLAMCSVAVALAVCVRYAQGLWTAPAVFIACAVMLVVTGAGLIAAVVVPSHIYSPLFKQLVEWIGYVLLIAPFPLAFWVMNVFAAIRYRS
ncbi:type VII secretion integral membrane protein EccD [Mycolicibacterium septicum]|uniref:type VII secretion integral membrane protein EccD n=1 Tax=Mycolicibacterium septicum TaxID=98668 RepID=UPI003B5921A5